jgi:hypothetical protein
MNERDLRMHSKMSAFTFYIDDLTKLSVIKKLKTLGIDEKKGSISATIRVLLRLFAEHNLDIWECDIVDLIKDEYLFTTKKNKRSSL